MFDIMLRPVLFSNIITRVGFLTKSICINMYDPVNDPDTV